MVVTTTAITVVSGFLGAGKTTLIKALLKRKAFGLMPLLIENDYGSLGIDASLIQESGVVIEEVDSGCICCTLVGRFQEGVKRLLEEYHPQHLIIEPSGVGKLSKVLQQLAELKLPEEQQISQPVSITVVDASRFDHNDTYVHDYFWDQIERSDVVLANRITDLPEQDGHRIMNTLYERTQYSPVLSGMNDDSLSFLMRYLSHNSAYLDRELLRSNNRKGLKATHSHKHEHVHEHEHEHDARHDFQSWSTEVEGNFSREQLTELARCLQDDAKVGNVMRAKGIFRDNDRHYLFDYVPGHGTVQEFAAQETPRFMVIGRSLNTENLEILLHKNRSEGSDGDV